MSTLRFARSPLATGVGLALVAALIGFPAAEAAPLTPAAPAVPAALQATGPYAATADASLVTLDLPGASPVVLPQTAIDLAHSSADADSDGDLDGVQAGDQRTAAIAQTTGSTAVTGVDLGGVQTNQASAPEDEVGTNTLIPLALAPVLDLPAVQTAALANWAGDDQCVADGTPLSAASQIAADTTVLDLGGGQSIFQLDTDDDDGASDTETETGLAAIPGANDPRAVQARTTSTISSASLFDGFDQTGPVLAVDVVQNPDYVVRASGLPGGASVTGDDPIVRVTTIGDAPVVVDGADDVVEQPATGVELGEVADLPSGNLEQFLTDLGLGALYPALQAVEAQFIAALAELQPIIRFSVPVEIEVLGDGTMARVDAALLRVELLPPAAVGAAEPFADALNEVLAALGLDTTEPLLVHDLGHVSAQAVAPAGGITCGDDSNPLEVAKVNSGPAIPGSSFDYTIAVGNVGDCTMDPVRVVDTVVGPPGTTIGITEPSGATVTDLGGGDWRVEWANVGPLAPDGRTTLRIRVNVGTNAPVGERFRDDVTGTAAIQAGPGCTPREVTRTATLPEPEVVGRPSGPCNITGSTKGKSHLQVYPNESFVYYVNVLNGGSEPCTDVTVVDPIDSRLTFESCSDGCTFTAPNATWRLGTLAPGQSVTLRLQVKVNLAATGTLANTATIDTAETPPHVVDIGGPDITTVSVQSPGNPASLPASPRTPSRELARTGAPSSVPAPVLLALGLLALGARHLRRRLTVV